MSPPVAMTLVGRLSDTLTAHRAPHLLAPVFAVLGPHLHPTAEKLAPNVRPVVEVALVRRLVGLVGPVSCDLIPAILDAAAPWLVSTPPRASTVTLTAFEQVVIEFASHGLSNPAIARRTGYSADYVKSTLSKLYIKLRARDRAHAVRRGLEVGALTLSSAQPADEADAS
jgi:DNA-binding CsgD family transcriptional regulator